MLGIADHSRDSAGMIYVYPVVSRRAAGVSIGVNLNPNNACNWRCIYCQVPDLKRGGPPPLDLARLRRELSQLLYEVIDGDFMVKRVPEGSRRLMDVAFSGNGEPTSAPELLLAVDCVRNVLEHYHLLGRLPVRLITNGSLVDRPRVKEALKRLAEMGGEVWFKVDGLAPGVISKVNNSQVSLVSVMRRLGLCADLCPTWVQSCFFAMDGRPPAAAELNAYVDGLGAMVERIHGVHLYGLARPSLQPEAPRLERLSDEWFDCLASRLKEKGLTVAVSP